MKVEDFMKGWDAYRNAADDPDEDEPGKITHPSQKPDPKMITVEDDARQMGLNKIYETKKLTPKEFADCVDLCEGE